MFVCGLVALWAMTLAPDAQALVFAGAGALYVAAILLIERAWRRRDRQNA